MTKQRSTDAEILEVCAGLTKDRRPVSVRSVHTVVGGNWGRIAGLVRAFKLRHDAAAQQSFVDEELMLSIQQLTLELDRSRKLNADHEQRIKTLEQQLDESNRNAIELIEAMAS